MPSIILGVAVLPGRRNALVNLVAGPPLVIRPMHGGRTRATRCGGEDSWVRHSMMVALRLSFVGIPAALQELITTSAARSNRLRRHALVNPAFGRSQPALAGKLSKPMSGRHLLVQHRAP